MQEQIKYITDLARLYKGYSDNQAELYKAVNSIPKNEVEEIFKECGDPESPADTWASVPLFKRD